MRDRDQDTMTLPKLKVETRSTGHDAERPANRADEIRARRSTRLQPVSTSTARSGKRTQTQKPLPAARYIVPTRPVVVRTTTSSVPLHKIPTNKTRRQYHIALNTPGAEIRLPSVSIGRPGWRILSGFVVMAMIAALYALISLPQFQFGPAEITGAQRVTTADIDGVLKTEGMPAFAVRPQALAASLQSAFPEFSQVAVSVGLPASLSIAVVERQPAIAWQQGDNTLWLDSDGYAFPARGDAGATLVTVQASGNPPSAVVKSDAQASTSTDPTAVPTAANGTSGQAASAVPSPIDSTRPYVSPELISAVLSLSTQAPQGTPIVYDPVHGLGWTDPRGWQVYFGSTLSDMDVKLAEYNAIVQQLTQQEITPVMISVEFPHAPFYRTEK